ncbi:TonB-dependent receptor [Ideonella azotifigens]|nr:TonB-dependent receptor [Ideonella azotifigens]
MKNSSTLWRRSAVAVAVGLSVMSGAVYAQSTAVGSVYGQVATGAGTQIVIENAAVGFKRTVTVGEGGRFQANNLAPGHYQIQLVKDGKVVSTAELDVLAGQGAEAVFAGAGNATQTVQVVGKLRGIDTSNTVNASVFTAKQLDAIPVASKDVNGIVALAANTTKADARYSGGISIGGGAPSENSYYINGFPVTNALTQLGSMELPFGAIQQAQVQTGGFGAEFGRSVGGVVNIITKSGTNEWHGGVDVTIEPNSLRSNPKNIYYPKNGAATDGTEYFYRKDNYRQETSYGAYVGGPLVEDKLFMFVAADVTKLNTKAVNSTPGSSAVSTTGWLESQNTNTRYLGKFDWYLTSDHHLEATLIGDNYKTTDDYFGYDYAAHKKTNYVFSQYSKNLSDYTTGVGGDAQVLKYSGQITSDFLLTALYGQSSSPHKQGYSFQPTDPETFIPTDADRNPNLTYPTNPANPLPGGTTGIGNDAKETTKSFRFDLEYQLGDHLIRAGLDENRLKSKNAGDSYDNVGGSYWRYYHTTNGNYSGAGPSTRISLIDAGAVPVNGTYYYARQRHFDTVTNADSNQSAQYIEDRWQVTKEVLLTAGVRRESFENKNGDGDTFLKMDGFFSPRLSASWDVLGNSSLKVYGSAGRYSLQIPTHVAVRGASRSLFVDQYFAYTGVDPVTGAPTGLTALNSEPYSSNNEYGQAKNPKTVAAQDMKPTYQDELTLGVEGALTQGLVGGAKVTYRKLKQTIDDFCDYRPFYAYADANGIDTSNYGGFGCATFNPGSDNTFLVDYAGDGTLTKVKLKAADIGVPKPKRTYFALDLFLEHPFSDGWYGKINYTYSKNKGNTEGQTKSDNAQTDVAVTSTWDFKELMEGSYGYLPNDRTHQIKGYGYYQLTPEWGFGTTMVLESGRPKNCFGDYGGTGTDIGGGGYGAVFFYCDGVATPRGSQGRLPWSTALDLNAVYKPDYVKGLALRVDVFNVFNRQTARVIDEAHDSSATYGAGVVNPAYGRVISYSDPRKFRLTAQYDF